MTNSKQSGIRNLQQDLTKVAQRMEGNSASQIFKAIETYQNQSKMPVWLRTTLFPVSILLLFATLLVMLVWVIQQTRLPVPWDVQDQSWYLWHLIVAAQTAITGVLYHYGERKYGKMPGIPRGSFYSLLVIATLLPGLILSLLLVSHLFARYQIQRGQSGIWMRSLGGWTPFKIILGSLELVLIWLFLISLSFPAAEGSSGLMSWLNWSNSPWLAQGLVGLALFGLIQALTASLLIVAEIAIEEEAADVTPLLACLAPLVVLSPIGIFMLITYLYASSVNDVWLGLLKFLGVLWCILVLSGARYVVQRWELIYQSVIIMLVGYLMMLPFFVDHVQNLASRTSLIEQQDRRDPYAVPIRPAPKKSYRAIDILRE